MNTKQILIALAIVTAMSATAVMAENSAPAPAASAAATATEGGHKGRHGAKFEDIKARALKKLEDRAAKIQQQQACVQAATDKAALKACYPKRGKGKGKFGAKGKSDTGAEAPAPAPAGK